MKGDSLQAGLTSAQVMQADARHFNKLPTVLRTGETTEAVIAELKMIR